MGKRDCDHDADWVVEETCRVGTVRCLGCDREVSMARAFERLRRRMLATLSSEVPARATPEEKM